jgi:hypothetical protein
MRNIICVVVAILLMGCAKETLRDGRMSDAEVYERFVEIPSLHYKDSTNITSLHNTKSDWALVNLDSLIQTGYYVWYDIFANGSFISYEEGEFGPITAFDSYMRFGPTGYGRSSFLVPSGQTITLGVTNWPSGTIPGSEIIELNSFNTARSWILRKDVLPVNQGLAFCTSFNGFANEGFITGRVDAFYRDPQGNFFEVDPSNTTSCLITLTNCCEMFTGAQDYGAITFVNQVNANGDVFQECSVVNYRCDVSIVHPEFFIQSNTYFGNYRSPFQSDNTCGGSDNYILQDGEVLGEFVNN